MSRGKTVSDDLLLDRLMAPMMAHGPADLSFAKAANAAGLAAATLVQRFRNRERMVEAILLRAWDRLDEATAAADARASPDPPGAIELLLRLTNSDAAEFDFTDGLLLLREDIRNPVLRARGAQWGLRLAEALGRRLGRDADRGTQLGWQMASLWQGTLIWWAFRRDAEPAVKVREILEDWSRTAGLLR
ncbi:MULTISPECIES: TetR family transcriptional regulator [unclassified Phenylobacterium]|uniref:TetR family transcriptional regulator n=1 Tax=unclassified Phenylobacterium TaxID=2640670 RepID=UPI00083A5F26|nr:MULTISPECIES: TetR family transcriptional regulator [unclassified Phenylobacterium]